MSILEPKKNKEIGVYFLVNILAPIVLPWVSVFALWLFFKIEIVNFGFETLWEGGVFAFLCLFAYINLVPDFFKIPKTKRKDSFSIIFGFALFIIGIASILFFMSFLLRFLPISNTDGIKSFSENFYIFNIIMTVGVFVSIVFKGYIVRLKTVKQRREINFKKLDKN